jgi:BirA family transcriptional regulator, biotin operon repressor / biotin---[acetyl-CoA-carboxylase] ligase
MPTPPRNNPLSEHAVDPDRVLLQMLGGGGLHSGEYLARGIGVSRAAVWKRLGKLEARGAPLERVRGRGYRLRHAVELLDPDRIGRTLRPDVGAALRIAVSFATDSTNRRLLEAPECHGAVLAAEFQDSGRGRRGNTWISPIASGICLSLGWRFDTVFPDSAALSILAGAAVARALHRVGAHDVGLKWPNDLVCGGGKLGGLLIESRAQFGGAMDVVIGVGINVRLPGALHVTGDNRPVDLAACGSGTPSRNELMVFLLEELVDMLHALAAGRTLDHLEFWRRHDAGAGREAELRLGTEVIRGRVLGISDQGLLRLAVGGTEREFASGELSLRLC